MRQQAVIAHPYAQAQRNPVESQGSEESRPTEEKEGSDRPKVKDSEGDYRSPVDSLLFNE
jgi:hypothetical protein